MAQCASYLNSSEGENADDDVESTMTLEMLEVEEMDEASTMTSASES